MDLPGSALEVRLACRSDRFRGATAGMAPGCVQGNVVILPTNVAAEFLCFCQWNPKPCPIIGVSEPGVPHTPELGSGLDSVPTFRNTGSGRADQNSVRLETE